MYLLKNRYAHYLSLATLASNVAFVVAVLFEFLCRDIFALFYHTFSAISQSMDECPKIRKEERKKKNSVLNYCLQISHFNIVSFLLVTVLGPGSSSLVCVSLFLCDKTFSMISTSLLV